MKKNLFLLLVLSAGACMVSCDKIASLFKVDDEASSNEEEGNCSVEWYNVDATTPILTTKGNTGKAVSIPKQEITHPTSPELFTFAGWNTKRQEQDIGDALDNKELVIPDDATTYKLYAVYKIDKKDCLIKENGETVKVDKLISDGYISIDSDTLTVESKLKDKTDWGKYSLVFDTKKFKVIKSQSFENVTNLKNIIFSSTSSLETISEKAFKGCTSLFCAVIPDSVKLIDNYAFNGCTTLEAVKLPSSLTQINAYLFQGCTNLKSIAIPKGVINIYQDSFKSCTSLIDVTIPDTVEKYYFNIFDGCTSLETITLPKPAAKATIELSNNTNNMFNGCSKLKTIHFTGTKYEFQSIQNWKNMGFNDTVLIECADGQINPRE